MIIRPADLETPSRVFVDGLASSESGSAHLVGICGAGMSALALMLRDLAWRVSGSDSRPSESVLHRLAARGIDVSRGHAAGHVSPSTQLLIHSAAIPPTNPERVAARALGIPEHSYSQALGQLMQARKGICIAGTHGKSTTAAMTATILRHAGRDPSACMGAELCGDERGGWAGAGELFVVESCEYRRSFLDLTPSYAAILSVEPDHFDCFGTFRETCDAFRQFAGRVLPGGRIVTSADCPQALKVARNAGARLETFSIQGEADWTAGSIRTVADRVQFHVFHHEERFAEIGLRVAGRHNVLNALAAIALCHAVGLDRHEIARGLSAFRGVRRRFERVGIWKGVTLIDDYAHHPTEIRATLQTSRECFGGRRVWCVFQPHQVSRTRALMNEFTQSLSSADESLIAPVYAAREAEGPETASTSAELASRVVDAGGRARYVANLDRIVATLEDEARPGDVVLTMGAGDIDQVHHELTRPLQRNLAS